MCEPQENGMHYFHVFLKTSMKNDPISWALSKSVSNLPQSVNLSAMLSHYHATNTADNRKKIKYLNFSSLWENKKCLINYSVKEVIKIAITGYL